MMRTELVNYLALFDRPFGNTHAFRPVDLQVFQPFSKEEWDYLLGNPNPIIRQALARHFTLNKRAVDRLSRDSDWETKSLLVEGHSRELTGAQRRRLAFDEDPRVRFSLVRNSWLPDDLFTRYMRDPASGVKLSAVDYLRRLRKMPADFDEATGGSDGKPPVDSGNARLAREIGAEPQQSTWFSQHPEVNRQWVDTVGCWRSAGENDWQIFGTDTGPDLAPFAGQITLQAACDGVFRAWKVAKEGKVIVHGAIQRKREGFRSWERVGKLGRFQGRHPDLQFLFPDCEAKLLGSDGEVELVGQLIYQLSMFALWSAKGELVGWTEVPSADTTPRHRHLDISDLAPRYWRPHFEAAQGILRQVSAMGLGL
jgi:hypothetical protein